ncbi:PAS domain S-box protein [Geomonas sp. Red69]|uniref:PAS domain S-box protein n=1 Tax=Geomonas diazotrophica TaxID=2843197 RepID=UPI001C1101C1|nr:PAS domain S-box protein [Geomonas diazotrophica]MBU5636262.1 PAS domain S-box protein [Geomonas diazotrophica]
MLSRLRKGRWFSIGTGSILILASWLTDSFLDAVVFSEGSFVQQLLHPEAQELTYRLQTILFLLIFMTCAWRKSRSEQEATSALEDTVAKLALEKSRTEAILASVPDAVTVQDRDFRILYQNPPARQFKGEHLGQPCYSAYHDRDTVCPGCVVNECFLDGLPHRQESTHVIDGQTRHIETAAAPLMDATGAVTAAIELVRDVTERKTKEIMQKQHSAAIEASIDGIALLNPDGEYLYLNKAHAAIYGYPSQQELIGRTWKKLYTDEERQRLEPLIYGAFQKGDGWRGQATGLKKDGSLFPQEISLSRLEDGGIICVVRDTSERQESEEAIRKLNGSLRQQTLELQATNRELEAFSYSLSHDLRTPLTTVYGAGQALADIYRDQLDETGQCLLNAIHTGCENMEEFIEAMLVLFRVTRTELSCEEVDLGRMADDIIAELRSYDVERSLKWQNAAGMTAWCDPHLARVLLQNLLGNAWKYTSRNEHTCIEFGQRMRDGVREFFVRDNGIGFEMSEADKIFKPFQRLRPSSDYPGTGVGLATVFRIVDRHGGEVRAEGEVGKGACFYFTLPGQQHHI